VTDPELLAKKLAMIETCVAQLRRIADLEKLRTDVREERFVVHTLQIAIQAALDVASHIVSDERLGEPETHRQLFDLLAGGGWLREDQVPSLRRLAGVRNVVVHGYQDVDLGVVEDVVRSRLGDLLDFAETIRSRLQ